MQLMYYRRLIYLCVFDANAVRYAGLHVIPPWTVYFQVTGTILL